jgi:tripartite-type tricarboxylate transporter receptor subunit TctC
VAKLKTISVQVLLAILCGAAHAQQYPSKPITVVNPYAGGTGLDSLVRAVSQKISEDWGQPVLVVNKPGANSIIGTESVAKAPPDGYTVLVSTPPLVNNVSLYRNLPFETFRDLTAVSGLVTTTPALAVHPSVPANSMKEFIELAKAQPGKLTHGSLGVGSTFHLTVALLESIAGISLHHIPYKGSPIPDLLAGHVDIVFPNIGSVFRFAQAGKLKLLGVASLKRLPQFPDLPTLAESGVPGYEVSSWIGLHAPAATPAALVTRLNTEAQSVLMNPAFRGKYLEPEVFEPLVGSPEQFGAFLKSESLKWGKIIREAGIKLD